MKYETIKVSPVTKAALRALMHKEEGKLKRRMTWDEFFKDLITRSKGVAVKGGVQ